jgi:hypothetical protein
MAAICGGPAVLIEWLSYTLSLVLVPLVVLSFALFTAYLAQVKVVSERDSETTIRREKTASLVDLSDV